MMMGRRWDMDPRHVTASSKQADPEILVDGRGV